MLFLKKFFVIRFALDFASESSINISASAIRCFKYSETFNQPLNRFLTETNIN